jgi:hypothetical protein
MITTFYSLSLLSLLLSSTSSSFHGNAFFIPSNQPLWTTRSSQTTMTIPYYILLTQERPSKKSFNHPRVICHDSRNNDTDDDDDDDDDVYNKQEEQEQEEKKSKNEAEKETTNEEQKPNNNELSLLNHDDDDTTTTTNNNNGIDDNEAIDDANTIARKNKIESTRRQLESLISEAKTPGRTFSIRSFLASCRSSIRTISAEDGEDDDEHSNNDNNNDNNDDDDDDDWKELLPPPPPMSSMERARRVQEMALLKSLCDSDEASSQLWNLWYSEKGPQKQTILAQTDDLLADPNSWDKCETELIRLIDEGEHGVYFVEAVNRLATLYFLMGRLEESYKLCRVVLHLKPWHVGALSGMVQVCIGLGQREEARFWAHRRLPTLAAGTSFPPFTDNDVSPTNPRRQEWCDRAVADANELLKRAEQYTKKSLGRPEEYYYSSKKNRPSALSSSSSNLEEENAPSTSGVQPDEGAWQ